MYGLYPLGLLAGLLLFFFLDYQDRLENEKVKIFQNSDVKISKVPGNS
jgi:hypothetical protein